MGDKEKETNNVPRQFIVYYCELQQWGAHRCKSKIKEDDAHDAAVYKQYSMTIDHLRMATKYSFHVKALGPNKEQKASGRADLNGNILKDGDDIEGQTIIIPTKGCELFVIHTLIYAFVLLEQMNFIFCSFNPTVLVAAHATTCLPDMSEIEVETGPYFGGKIVAENNNCFVQGDPLSERSSYTMKLEHEKCGSHVDHETLTVETFITVQENLGILTHSTRRFMVVCTFQPNTLTVRARLVLPGKGGAQQATTQEWWPDNGRSARERQFKMVNKTALVLKEDYEEVPAAVTEEIEEVPMGIGNSAENVIQGSSDNQQEAQFASLRDERQHVPESFTSWRQRSEFHSFNYLAAHVYE